jgi:8-oxo-dGTP pyrophosphatase MutT (NUDIX family)
MTDTAKNPATPRAASTILLLRDGPTGLEVFMVVRHHEIDFASGALVFPGGRMEAADAELAREGAPFADGLDGTARALRIAAIREAFEECGVLLARPAGEERFVPAERASALDRSAPFAGLMARERLLPATDALVPFARWITPAFLPKRFDTHFFLALAPPDHALAHDGRETVDSLWIAPRDAL